MPASRDNRLRRPSLVAENARAPCDSYLPPGGRLRPRRRRHAPRSYAADLGADHDRAAHDVAVARASSCSIPLFGSRPLPSVRRPRCRADVVRLARAGLRPGEFAARLGFLKAKAVYHLRVARRAGLVPSTPKSRPGPEEPNSARPSAASKRFSPALRGVISLMRRREYAVTGARLKRAREAAGTAWAGLEGLNMESGTYYAAMRRTSFRLTHAEVVEALAGAHAGMPGPLARLTTWVHAAERYPPQPNSDPRRVGEGNGRTPRAQHSKRCAAAARLCPSAWCSSGATGQR